MCNENRRWNELEKRIYSDIQSEIYRYYDNLEMRYKNKEEPEDTLIDFLSYLYRLISPHKRKVYYSKELQGKIDSNEISKKHIDILKNFAKAFADGENMNGFLSNNTKKPREIDFLQYTWHLYHLHMSDKFVEDREQMKNNRSDMQLLCIIKEDVVYFIDIINHPQKPEEYFNMKILEIVEENDWMKEIEFYEVEDAIPSSFEPIIKNNNDIFNIYSKVATNIGFEVNGKVYIPLVPMTSNRRPQQATEEFIWISKKIRNLKNLNYKYIGFRFAFTIKGLILGLVEFSIQKDESAFYNIF